MIWINLLRSLGRHGSPVMEVGSKTEESRVAVHLPIFAGDFPAGFEKVPCRGLLARLAVGPTNAQEIPGVVEILLQPAVEGTLHSGANPARQVEIGCRDDDRFVFLFDADNAIEWMLSFFGVLLVARKADNLVHVVPSKNAMQFNHTRREIVIDAPTRCTKRLTAAFGCRRPPPAPPW
jgi:hypothetical protein